MMKHTGISERTQFVRVLTEGEILNLLSCKIVMKFWPQKLLGKFAITN